MNGNGGSGDLELIAEMAADCHRGVELIADISRKPTFFARSDDATMESVNIRELINNTRAMTLNEIRYRAEFEQRVGEVPNIIGNRSRLSLGMRVQRHLEQNRDFVGEVELRVTETSDCRIVWRAGDREARLVVDVARYVADLTTDRNDQETTSAIVSLLRGALQTATPSQSAS